MRPDKRLSSFLGVALVAALVSVPARAQDGEYDWDALDDDETTEEQVDEVADEHVTEDPEYDPDALDDDETTEEQVDEVADEHVTEDPEYDWDALDDDEVAEEQVTGDAEYDWDALDDDEATEDAEYDPDALDDDGVAEEQVTEDAEYDWNALDDDGATEDEGYDWDALDEAETDDDGFDWDDLEEAEAVEDDVDWDSYWDELDSYEEPVEAVEVPTEVAEDTGGVQGVVVDDQTEQPFPRATVTVSGTGLEARTDTEGRFFFELEPGTYIVRIDHFELSAVSYEVLVERGEITDLAYIRMRPSENTSTIVVEGRAVQESTAQQLRERQESTTVQDAISAEQISQAGDSSAASAVRRVVGVTLLDDRFLVVRGLMGRYTAVTLNGIPVPLTDPDYPSAEVDIFPTELLSSLTLAKNPAADTPTFTGGLMDIETRSYPEEFTLSLSASISGDTNTTFQEFYADDAGSFDALGFDDGSREWPDLPDDEAFDRRRTEDYLDLAHDLPDHWTVNESTARPNFGLKANLGDTLELGERDLGYLVILSYSNAMERTLAERSKVRRGEEELEVVETLDVETYTMKTTWGALGNLAFDLADGHSLRYVGMWNHMGRDRYRLASGDSDEESAFLDRSSWQWLQRALVFNQLIGSHRQLLPETSPFHETRVDWRAAVNLASREEPDNRDLKFLNDGWDVNPGSGEHFTSDLSQTDVFGGLDFELPYLDAFRFDAGGSVYSVSREWRTRRLRYVLGSGEIEREFFDLPPAELFADENVTEDGTPLNIREFPNEGDNYDYRQLALAGYGSVEVHPIDWLRIVAGARYESFNQNVSDIPLDGEPDPDNEVDRTDTDVLPSGSLIFEVADDMFVRGVYGGSVARPTIREIASFVFQDYIRRRTVTGNPDLIRTYVHNADLRWEWFPSPTEVVAASFFYKGFLHPIEATLINRQGDVQYLNAEGSTNLGAEFEVQLELGRLGERAAGFFVGGNVAIVHSEIDLPCDDADDDGECDEQYTNSSRPMQGQAPWQVNARFGWDRDDHPLSFTLLYTVLGKTLTDVGTLGNPDIYEQPFHQLDLSVGYEVTDQWKLSLKLRNLLFDDIEETQGSQTSYDEQVPLDFGLSVRWQY